MTLILPVGPPGCGKSLLAQKLLETEVLSQDAIVSPDVMRRVITGSRSNQLSNADVFAICNAITRGRLRNGLTVYYDATNLTALPELREMALSLDTDIICVRFALPEAVLRIRNETRLDPVPDHVLHTMIERFTRLPLESYPGTVITPDEALVWAKKGWLT